MDSLLAVLFRCMKKHANPESAAFALLLTQ